MKPDAKFSRQSKQFWAYVRTISQHIGYTKRGKQEILVPTQQEILEALNSLKLRSSQIIERGALTELGSLLIEYFSYRANVINNQIRPNLMDGPTAKALYESTKREIKPSRPAPMNKQKGRKKAPAYLTAMVNMIVESNCGVIPCDYDPRELTSVTVGGFPVRTLARRVDGAFPSAINPIAIWELKEYYYTTTFGSRVADGVYETLLDGLELEELKASERVDVKHYLIFDGQFTWWNCGRSYLCRIVDMLHMGYVDEILVGKEILTRLPQLVKEWVDTFNKTKSIEPHPIT